MKFEDFEISESISAYGYYASYSTGQFSSSYIYEDGTSHSCCRAEKDSDGWFDSHEDAEKAVKLFIKKQNKPTRGIIATLLYNMSS